MLTITSRSTIRHCTSPARPTDSTPRQQLGTSRTTSRQPPGTSRTTNRLEPRTSRTTAREPPGTSGTKDTTLLADRTNRLTQSEAKSKQALLLKVVPVPVRDVWDVRDVRGVPDNSGPPGTMSRAKYGSRLRWLLFWLEAPDADWYRPSMPNQRIRHVFCVIFLFFIFFF